MARLCKSTATQLILATIVKCILWHLTCYAVAPAHLLLSPPGGHDQIWSKGVSRLPRCAITA
jgi:hypothetical protein